MASASHTPGFIETTARALQAIRIVTLDSIKDLLVHDDPCLRAAAAYYLHLLATSQGLYPPGVVQAVRHALEECWHDEQHLGVLIVLDQCLDGNTPVPTAGALIERIRKTRPLSK
jgi:hypothetical protein